MYKLTQPNEITNKVEYVVRKSDHTFIPLVEGNRDYQEYLKWVAKGNKAIEADKETE